MEATPKEKGTAHPFTPFTPLGALPLHPAAVADSPAPRATLLGIPSRLPTAPTPGPPLAPLSYIVHLPIFTGTFFLAQKYNTSPI